jgi:2-methylcitrate dehydratase PrpD
MSASSLDPLAEFAARIDTGALDPEVVEKSKACLLYGLAVGTASMKAAAPRIAAQMFGTEYAGASESATRLIDGRRMPAVIAAYCNAALLHARVQEDAHPCGHLGVVVLPAALAVAERVGARGRDVLAAIVAGYEVALRIGRDHATDLSKCGFRTTSAYGVFGAAACAARLMKLDARQTRDALSLAASMAGGLREFVDAGTEEYPFQAGFAARNGIEAARLAATGVAAAPGALDGAAGFYRAFAGQSKDYGRRIAERLGEQFEFMQIAYKPYPACQFNRGMINGVLNLRSQAGDAEPDSMIVRMYPFEADFLGVRFTGPFTTFPQTFMSAPFCAALAWVKGAVSYAGMHTFGDREVLRLLPRVQVVADPSRAPYQPHVSVMLAGATTLAWDETEGSEKYRLTWDTATRMASSLCAEAGVPADKLARLGDTIAHLDTAGSVRDAAAAAADACAAALAQ